MTTLIIAIAIAVCVSFICSLAEAGLFAVGPAYVRLLEEKGSRIGKILSGFKDDMDKPISAILITNTIANVVMASFAGGAAYHLWGDKGTVALSIIFTLAILFFGEIIPKVLGVTYSRGSTFVYAYPLNLAVKVLSPIIWITGSVSSLISKGRKVAKAPEEEILALAKISAEEGSILPIEKQIIMHALKLNNVHAKEIMTPRTVMLSTDGDKTLEDIEKEALRWQHSRIPVFEKEPENIVSLVLRRDIISEIAKETDPSAKVKQFAKAIHCVPEMQTADKILAEFLKQKSHLFGVVDEYGEITGVVSLEDVLETLIGTEIVDETDFVADLQELARSKWRQRKKERNLKG